MAAVALSSTILRRDPSLIAYYALNGNSTDAKGTYTGTDTSMTYSAANFSTGAVFAGTPAHITIPSTLTLNVCTISVWVNFSNTAGQYEVIRFATSSGVAMGFSNNRGGAGFIDCYTFNTPTFTNIEYTTSLAGSGWHHAVMTRAGANAELFVDGVSRGTSSAFDSGTFGGIHNSFGNSVSTSAGYYIGSMDDIAIFNRVLSAAEISGLYNGTLAGTTTSSLAMMGMGA